MCLGWSKERMCWAKKCGDKVEEGTGLEMEGNWGKQILPVLAR